MPGKYSKFKDSLTKFSGEPEYLDKVRAKREEILKSLEVVNLKTLSEVFVTAKLEKKRLEAEIKAQNLILEAVTQELVEMMEAEAYNKVDIEGGVSLSIKDDVYCSVENKVLFHQWIRDNNLEDLLTVNYQTMSSMVKALLVASDPIPPGVGTYFKQGITVRGIKNLED